LALPRDFHRKGGNTHAFTQSPSITSSLLHFFTLITYLLPPRHTRIALFPRSDNEPDRSPDASSPQSIVCPGIAARSLCQSTRRRRRHRVRRHGRRRGAPPKG